MWLQRDPKLLGLLQEVYAYQEIPVETDVKMWKYLENRINLLLLTQYKLEYDVSAKPLLYLPSITLHYKTHITPSIILLKKK